jgi:hypothetical protein
MTLGEVVAVVGAVELLVLVLGLAATLLGGGRPVGLGVEAPAPREQPQKAKEAA